MAGSFQALVPRGARGIPPAHRGQGKGNRRPRRETRNETRWPRNEASRCANAEHPTPNYSTLEHPRVGRCAERSAAAPGAPRSGTLDVGCWVLDVSRLFLLLPSPRPAEEPDRDSPEAELASFKLPPGFEIHLWASERDGVAKPIQIRWDTRGRLWVIQSTTYPQLKPGEIPNDKVLILEDTKHGGYADKVTVFADHLMIPTGLEIAPVAGGSRFTVLRFLVPRTGPATRRREPATRHQRPETLRLLRRRRPEALAPHRHHRQRRGRQARGRAARIRHRGHSSEYQFLPLVAGRRTDVFARPARARARRDALRRRGTG